MIYPEDRQLWLAKPKDADDLAEKIKYNITNRPDQRLVGKIAIDELVVEFLDYIREKIL